MEVQRINVNLVEGNEVNVDVHLEQIFNEAAKALAQVQMLEKEPQDEAGDSAEAEICSKTDC